MKKIAMLALSAFALNAMAEEAVVEQDVAATEVNAFDGLFVGAGIGGNFLKHTGKDVKDMKVNRFAGDIFFGYGKTFNGKFYVAGEMLMEFAQSKTKDVELNDGTKNGIKVKTQMFTPELTLKAGYIYCNNMFYAKAGIARPTAKIMEKGEADHKTVKIVPVVYLGVARAFGNWVANIEGGYQFRQKYGNDKVNQGWKVRAGISRAFNLF